MSEFLEKVRSRGHWKVIIRPGTFDKNRVPNFSELDSILQKTSVQLRGWDFPHLDPHVPIHRDIDWVEQESQWGKYLEVWRFYQSGQFVDFTGIDADWQDLSSWSPPPTGWKAGSFLDVEETIFRFSEILEFAARLALTQAGDEQMRVEVEIRRLKGRGLYLATRSKGSSRLRNLRASIEALPHILDLSRPQLVAEPGELALKLSAETFHRFGWDPAIDALRDIQAELLHRGTPATGRR